VPSTELTIRENQGNVWHVEFAPDPWAWSDWNYAIDEGRFNGRWDDLRGQFRTVYAGNTLYACLIEVLAKYRRDAALALELDGINEDPADTDELPARPAATVGYDWLELRLAASAMLGGMFCDINASATIAALWPRFARRAIEFGVNDFDHAALKDSGPRDLARSIASWLYALTDPVIDGIEFSSRYGDDLRLWAVFERCPSGETNVSPLLTQRENVRLTPETPELVEAFATRGLA
jgi:hypothetical protein